MKKIMKKEENVEMKRYKKRENKCKHKQINNQTTKKREQIKNGKKKNPLCICYSPYRHADMMRRVTLWIFTLRKEAVQTATNTLRVRRKAGNAKGTGKIGWGQRGRK
jgi:hypothetical protein